MQKGQLFLSHVTKIKVTKGGQEIEAVASPSSQHGDGEGFADDDASEGGVGVRAEVGEKDELEIELVTPDRDWMLRGVGREAEEWIEQLEHHVPYVWTPPSVTHHPPPTTRHTLHPPLRIHRLTTTALVAPTNNPLNPL